MRKARRPDPEAASGKADRKTCLSGPGERTFHIS